MSIQSNREPGEHKDDEKSASANGDDAQEDPQEPRLLYAPLQPSLFAAMRTETTNIYYTGGQMGPYLIGPSGFQWTGNSLGLLESTNINKYLLLSFLSTYEVLTNRTFSK